MLRKDLRGGIDCASHESAADQLQGARDSPRGDAGNEGIGEELVREKLISNYPIFSAANNIFKVSKIIRPSLLFVEPLKR